ncbi:Solute carrier family 35 member G1 [Holothuria leucospilota]|uniref:Solute carrier family 35 member G1 n=1 Tax=Holothuria leucospilota TaxID=206669 RepID=A0A9Q1CSX6_HOLLE|nr:Solute carrier family 35 member G1 [Holothuria leucospilota]
MTGRDSDKPTQGNPSGMTENEIVTTNSSSTQGMPQTGKNECSIKKMGLFLRRRHGLVLAVITAILFSFQSLFAAILTMTLDPFQVGFLQGPIFMICCLLLVLYAGVRPPGEYKHYLWLLGSGLSQAGNTCIIPLALSVLPVGDGVTISYTALIQVGFFSWIILKEPVRLFDLVFAFVAFLGVFFMARPLFIFGSNGESSGNYVTFHGVLYAIAGSTTIALFTVFSRKISSLGINSYFCMLFNVTMAIVISGIVILSIKKWRWLTLNEWLFAVLLGAVYAGSYATIFYALKVETATLVTVINTSEIVLAFLWQVLLLHQPPFWTSCVGAILILAACIGITLAKRQPPRSNPTEHSDTGEQ